MAYLSRKCARRHRKARDSISVDGLLSVVSDAFRGNGRGNPGGVPKTLKAFHPPDQPSAKGCWSCQVTHRPCQEIPIT